MSIKFTADFSGAIKMTRNLLNTGKALRWQIARWATETVKDLKRSAAGMQKGHGEGRGKSGQLARGVDMQLAPQAKALRIDIGTGLTSAKDVKYARIQDEGGTVKAKDKFFSIRNVPGRPRIGPFLTVPLRNVKGRMSNYPGAFAIRSKKGNFVVVQPLAFKSGKRKGQKKFKGGVYDPLLGRRVGAQAQLTPLFVLKSSVTIPASGWFTDVVNAREAILPEYTDPEVLLNIAAQLPQGGGL